MMPQLIKSVKGKKKGGKNILKMNNQRTNMKGQNKLRKNKLRRKIDGKPNEIPLKNVTTTPTTIPKPKSR